MLRIGMKGRFYNLEVAHIVSLAIGYEHTSPVPMQVAYISGSTLGPRYAL